MITELNNSSFAILQLGVAKVDGKLSLTDTEISFVPFNSQLGLGPYLFKCADIVSVEKAVGKGGGVIPVSTDAIRFTLSDEITYEFIIANPEQWVDAFKHLAAQQKSRHFGRPLQK